MKAIYINLDPYLAAFAAWLKGGKVGPAPTGPSIPLAVTIPLGCDVGVAIPGTGTIPDDFPTNEATIDGQTVVFGYENALPEHVPIAYQQTLGLSALAPAAKYAVVPWDAWEANNGRKVELFVGESDASGITIPFTVLVRRETASGPVDLVDFTPPASGTPSAADIKSALVAAGTGALAGVSLADTVLEDGKSVTGYVGEATVSLGAREVVDGDTITAVLGETIQS